MLKAKTVAALEIGLFLQNPCGQIRLFRALHLQLQTAPDHLITRQPDPKDLSQDLSCRPSSISFGLIAFFCALIAAQGLLPLQAYSTCKVKYFGRKTISMNILHYRMYEIRLHEK